MKKLEFYQIVQYWNYNFAVIRNRDKILDDFIRKICQNFNSLYENSLMTLRIK